MPPVERLLERVVAGLRRVEPDGHALQPVDQVVLRVRPSPVSVVAALHRVARDHGLVDHQRGAAGGDEQRRQHAAPTTRRLRDRIRPNLIASPRRGLRPESGTTLRDVSRIARAACSASRRSGEDRLEVLADRAVAAEREEAVEAAEEPAVVGDRDDGAEERVERLLERLGRREVEVVGRLVEQQQVRARQLEQQDLEPRLLAAGQRLERLGRARRAARSGAASPSPCPGRGRPSSPRRAPRRRAARAGRGSARSSRARPARRAARCRRGRPARPRAGGGSGSCRCRSGRAPRSARRRATSKSNGSVSPSSSSCSHTTTRVPVRLPPSCIDTCSSRTRSVGAVASNRSIFDFVDAHAGREHVAPHRRAAAELLQRLLQPLALLPVPAVRPRRSARCARRAPRARSRTTRRGSTRCGPRA